MRSQRQARLDESEPVGHGRFILWAKSGLESNPAPFTASCHFLRHRVTNNHCARLCAGGKREGHPGFPHPASSWERMLCRITLLAWDSPAGSGSISRVTAASKFRGQLPSARACVAQALSRITPVLVLTALWDVGPLSSQFGQEDYGAGVTFKLPGQELRLRAPSLPSPQAAPRPELWLSDHPISNTHTRAHR